MMQSEANGLHMTAGANNPFSQRPNPEEDRPFLIFAAKLLSISPEIKLTEWHSFRLNKLLTLQDAVANSGLDDANLNAELSWFSFLLQRETFLCEALRDRWQSSVSSNDSK
jgi:hypothetical protein